MKEQDHHRDRMRVNAEPIRIATLGRFDSEGASLGADHVGI